jgi:hypothetical protein
MSKIAGHLKLGSTGSGREAIMFFAFALNLQSYKPTNQQTYLHTDLAYLLAFLVCLVCLARNVLLTTNMQISPKNCNV